MVTDVRSMVDGKHGVLNRRIFADKDLYQQELEQVFGRCWLVIGHESQVAKPNDFVASYMGEDPILLTRDAKGKLHAFLNMCRHRGNRICRADEGNAPSFMCTYHGWTFATDGKLVGVPGYKEAYFEELDRSQWGLVEAGQIDSYKGLVFATWDKSAPSLKDYLGNIAFYLDLYLDRREGGTEFLVGTHKWILHSNWKFSADNFGGDGYHFPITHGSGITVGAVRRPASGLMISPDRFCVDAGNGHGVVTFGDTLSAEEQLKMSPFPIMRDYFLQTLPELRKRLGEVRGNNPGTKVGTVFPNMSFHPAPMIRLWHPRGPDRTEMWTYCIVDKAAPPELKAAFNRNLQLSFSPSGVVEQDDMSNWIQCTDSSKMWRSKDVLANLQLGLGRDRERDGIPGMTSQAPSESNQRAFYKRWAELMSASSWDQLK